MPGLNLKGVTEGDIVAALRQGRPIIVVIQGVHEGRIYGRALDGHYHVEFDAETGLETVVRRDIPAPTPEHANPRFLSILRGDWAEGMHITSVAKLPDHLDEAIRELDAMIEEADHRRRVVLMVENADLVREAIAFLVGAEPADAPSGPQ